MHLSAYLGATLALLSLATPSPAAQGTGGAGEITGYVRVAGHSEPPQGTVVTLQSDAGEIVQQVTPEGSAYFRFTSLRQGIYYVTAKAPGYRATTERADILTTRHASVYLSLLPDERS